MDLGIRDKVALVTGASEGIGYGIARSLSREGARVVMAARREDTVRAAAEALTAETGNPVHPLSLDITAPDAGTRLVAAAREAFGEPAILVTNGGGPSGGAFASLSAEDFEAAVDLGFLASVRLTRAALPPMLQAGWGRIVHVSSATVYEPNPDLFLSSSVRPAVVGFSKTLAREVAPQGVTVNLVCPGYVETGALRRLAERRGKDHPEGAEGAWRAMEEAVPQGRIGTPEEQGDAVAFLCSERAAYITGVALRVDGGKVDFLL
jgi:3-oxoacyl-[acyl-carrier protein] reductase